MITLEQIVNLTDGSLRIRITKGSEDLFSGYIGTLREDKKYDKLKQLEIENIGIHTDISLKRWKEEGLLPPLEPENLADYSFSDLQMSVYLRIRAKEE